MLSIIIPTLDEASQVVAAVESAGRAGGGEIIVVDGGSRDRTCELAAAAGAVVVSAPRGRGSQLSAGARRATGDILLFLHADCRLAPDCGRQIEAALAASAGDSGPRKKIAGGAFRQRIDAAGLRYRLLEWGNAFRARRLGLPYGDQAIFLRRDVYDKLGGFPEIPLMEDVALMRRLRRIGRPILLAGPVVVSPRRWRTRGIVRQTARNWFLLTAYFLGVPPEKLARWYGPRQPEGL